MPRQSQTGHRFSPGIRWQAFTLRLKAAMLVLFWLTFFGAGVLLPSQTFRALLAAPQQVVGALGDEDDTSDASERTSRNENPADESSRATDETLNIPSTSDDAATSASDYPFALAAVREDGAASNDAPQEEGDRDAAASQEAADDDRDGAAADAGSDASTAAGMEAAHHRLWWHLSADAMLAFVLSFVTYTPTNLALLCCFAAVMGSISRRMRDHGRQKRNLNCPECRRRQANAGKAENGDGDRTGEERPEDDDETDAHVIAGSMLRGLCIFLMVTSGLIVLTGDPFVEVSQEKYLRLAGAASLFAFIAGFHRHVLHNMIAPNRLTAPTRSK